MAYAETRVNPINKNVKLSVSVLKLKDKQSLRKLEELLKKKINSKWAIVYNRACLNENITPVYVKNIYIY